MTSSEIELPARNQSFDAVISWSAFEQSGSRSKYSLRSGGSCGRPACSSFNSGRSTTPNVGLTSGTGLLVGGSLEALDDATAALINYANSHRSFAAQAELWLNPSITIERREGGVGIGSVNERIVEVPFALRALGRVPPGSCILDFGSSESSLALSLATLGTR